MNEVWVIGVAILGILWTFASLGLAPLLAIELLDRGERRKTARLALGWLTLGPVVVILWPFAIFAGICLLIQEAIR